MHRSLHGMAVFSVKCLFNKHLFVYLGSLAQFSLLYLPAFPLPDVFDLEGICIDAKA